MATMTILDKSLKDPQLLLEVLEARLQRALFFMQRT